MRFIFFTFILLTTLGSCSGNYNADRFDKEEWLSHNDISDRYNPRSGMTKDLMDNYLRPGMKRDSIIILLGRPYSESVVYQTPKTLQVPDSVASIDSVGIEKFNDWHSKFSQPDTIMRYPIGWSTIDPNFLIIKLGKDSTTIDFWIEQG